MDNGELEELVHMRTRTSKTFSPGDKRAKLYTAPASIHYLKEGDWEDIRWRFPRINEENILIMLSLHWKTHTSHFIPLV